MKKSNQLTIACTRLVGS
jgi:hypothetical protein